MIYDLGLIYDKKYDSDIKWFCSFHTPDSWKIKSRAFYNEEKERAIAEALKTDEGRRELAEAMRLK